MAAGQSSGRAFENIMASMFYMLISAVPLPPIEAAHSPTRRIPPKHPQGRRCCILMARRSSCSFSHAKIPEIRQKVRNRMANWRSLTFWARFWISNDKPKIFTVWYLTLLLMSWQIWKLAAETETAIGILHSVNAELLQFGQCESWMGHATRRNVWRVNAAPASASAYCLWLEPPDYGQYIACLVETRPFHWLFAAAGRSNAGQLECEQLPNEWWISA